jgi:amidase
MRSVDLVEQCLERVATLDKQGPALNAVLELNPDALFLAKALDAEREAKGARGPLHGVPVLIKDNIATGDKMHTSAGSLALADSFAPRDAFLVRQLRRAGALILGKANLTEFANFMTYGMPGGYSSRGGQVRNPYDTEALSPSGSSSGSAVAVAAELVTLAVGTETSGSILGPADINSVVGIKPTVGLISRSGIIPIAHSQDTAGPFARNVAGAALLLGAMTGRDKRDPATWTRADRIHTDYTQFLDIDALQGARLGIPRATYHDKLSTEQQELFHTALRQMERWGAQIVDPADIPTAKELREHGSCVMLHEFKVGLNAYLAELGANAAIRSLADVIAFNSEHAEQCLRYGQTILVASQATSGTLTEPNYLRDRARDVRLSRTKGIDTVMAEYNLDALLFPGSRGASIGAKAGYPSICVPLGYTSDKCPTGITFLGRAYSEPRLIALAYAFEQRTQARIPPPCA